MIRRFLLASVLALVACGANAQTISGGSTSPGGSSPQVQYNNSGAFGGASGVTTDGTSVSVVSGAQTASYKSLSITQAFNNVGATFDAPLFVGITNTGSATGSVIADFQVGGTSLSRLGINGNFSTDSGFIADAQSHSTTTGALDLGATTSAIGIASNYRVAFSSLSGNGSSSLDTGFSRVSAGLIGIGTGAQGAVDGAVQAAKLQAGSGTALTLAAGEIGFNKITASGSAAGASGGKIELVCGTNAGTAKLIAYAGTSTTAVTILDNIGTGVTGC